MNCLDTHSPVKEWEADAVELIQWLICFKEWCLVWWMMEDKEVVQEYLEVVMEQPLFHLVHLVVDFDSNKGKGQQDGQQ